MKKFSNIVVESYKPENDVTEISKSEGIKLAKKHQNHNAIEKNEGTNNKGYKVTVYHSDPRHKIPTLELHEHPTKGNHVFKRN